MGASPVVGATFEPNNICGNSPLWAVASAEIRCLVFQCAWGLPASMCVIEQLQTWGRFWGLRPIFGTQTYHLIQVLSPHVLSPGVQLSPTLSSIWGHQKTSKNRFFGVLRHQVLFMWDFLQSWTQIWSNNTCWTIFIVQLWSEDVICPADRNSLARWWTW